MAISVADEFESEVPLIEAIRGGDSYAFGEFVRLHGRWVRGVIFGVLGKRECVDDVAQNAWTTVWRRIGELRDVQSWRSWLYRLVRNCAIDAGRDLSRRRTKRHPLAEEIDAATRDASPLDVLGKREQQGRVLRAIEGLPAIYREPFVLRHVNDWSYRQIGEVMGLPVDSVETRLVRARRLLREALGDGEKRGTDDGV